MQFTEGVILSGKETSTGRTSGETIVGAEGAVPVKGIISQAKGQSTEHFNRCFKFVFQRLDFYSLTSLFY
jgi:hypothetical protein